jgi:hypothetical protein
MNKYEVELTVSTSVTIIVEAEDACDAEGAIDNESIFDALFDQRQAGELYFDFEVDSVDIAIGSQTNESLKAMMGLIDNIMNNGK